MFLNYDRGNPLVGEREDEVHAEGGNCWLPTQLPYEQGNANYVQYKGNLIGSEKGWCRREGVGRESDWRGTKGKGERGQKGTKNSEACERHVNEKAKVILHALRVLGLKGYNVT